MSRYNYFFKGLTARNRERTEKLFHRIRRFDPVQEAAAHAGISQNQAYKHISFMGFTAVYLTAAEEALVKQHRENHPISYDDHARTIG